MYSRKSPLDSHSEHAVKAWTTACPDGRTLTPPLSVAKIQHGRSPVKKTPEKRCPGVGEVTKGMSCLWIRFCSASTDFSTSSDCWISNARVMTLTNLTKRVETRVAGGLSEDGGVGTAHGVPFRRRDTWPDAFSMIPLECSSPSSMRTQPPQTRT